MRMQVFLRRNLALIRIGVAIFLFGIATNSAVPQSSGPPAPVQAGAPAAPSPVRQLGKLELGKPVQRELKGGETDIYTIKVKKGQFLRVVTEQKGIDVVVTLVGPDDKKILEADTSNGAWGPEPASLIVDASGVYVIRIGSTDTNVAPGKYEVKVTDRRKPLPSDEKRISAERGTFEAAQLGAQPDPAAQKKAREVYEKVLLLWLNLGDAYESALAWQQLGGIYVGFGETQKALEAERKALEIWNEEKSAREKGLVLLELGKIYDAHNERKKGLEFYEAALQASHAAGDRPTEAIVLNQIGIDQDSLGDPQKAIGTYIEAQTIDREVGSRTEELTVLSNMAETYARLGERQKATEYATQALSLAREAHDRPAETHLLNTLGVLYAERGDPQKGIDAFNEALSISRSLGDRSQEAHVIAGLGKTYADLGDPRKAIDLYNQALVLSREVRDLSDEAIAVTQMGSAYSNLGELPKALECYTQALKISRTMSDRVEESISLSNIGTVYNLSGEFEKALDYYNQSLRIDQALGDRVGEATSLSNIGATYDSLGEKKKALDYMSQSLLLNRKVEDRSGEATSLNNIGRLYADIGENEKALDYFQQCLEIERAFQNPSREAAALLNIAFIYSELKQEEKALETLTKALELAKKAENQIVEAKVLHSLGKAAEDRGEKQKALEFYNQAIGLSRSIGDRSGEAGTLNNLAGVYEELGEKGKAIENYVQALSLAHTIKEPRVEAAVLSNLMKYWKENSDPASAIFFGKEAVNSYQAVRGKMQGLDKDAQRSFVRSKAGTYRQLAELLITEGRLTEAEQVLNLLKEEQYFEFIRRDGRSADSLTKPVSLTAAELKSHDEYKRIADQVTALGNEWEVLRAKTSRTPEEEARLMELGEKLTVANQERDRFFKRLYLEFGKNAQANQSEREVREKTSGLQSLVQELGAGTVALYTLVGDSRYSVIVITGSIMQAREYPITAPNLRRKVAAFLEALRNPTSDALPASQDLYKILIAPIAGDLKGAKAQTLVWSLNDVLRYVPMSALHDGQQYLVEKYRNVVITSSSMGRLKDAVNARGSNGVGMGVSKNYDGLGPLPAVPKELNEIIQDEATPGAAGVLHGTVMLDDEFTEKHMASALEKHYHVVHIASHFVLRPGNEANSYLLLGGKDVGGSGYHLTLAELRDNPVLSFEGIELLTLSGCETGTSGADADGREVDGLGITAQQRGAKAVMASLWDVPDESTGILMADFYRRWINTPGLTKAEAMRQAQRSMLHGAATKPRELLDAKKTATVTQEVSPAPYAHPYYWAPFILIGNWN